MTNATASTTTVNVDDDLLPAANFYQSLLNKRMRGDSASRASRSVTDTMRNRFFRATESRP